MFKKNGDKQLKAIDEGVDKLVIITILNTVFTIVSGIALIVLSIKAPR